MRVVLASKRKIKIMFSKSSTGNKQACYFPLLARFPQKIRKYGQQMRKYGQQMRNAVA